MKVGIITFTVENFGAQLQAYALQHKLSLLGYDAEICDVQIEPASEEIRKRAKNKEWKRSLFSKDFFRTLQRIISKIIKRNDCRIDKGCGINFKEFKENYLKCSKTFSADELRAAPNIYDVYVVGSDQVWSYVMSSILDIYFLAFTRKQRVSYASSFGVSKIPPIFHSMYLKYLNDMDAISIRESQGVNLARQLTTKTVYNVVDPTFLLSKEEWRNIFDNTQTPDIPYIFVYDLIESTYLTDYVLWLSKKENLKIISAAGKTPQQFISLIAHATHVVTTSFHGTALSINYGVNFTVICRASKSTNSGMTDICNDFGLKNHILMEGDKFKEPLPVVFDDYRNVLEKKIKFSVDFLKNNIKEKII